MGIYAFDDFIIDPAVRPWGSTTFLVSDLEFTTGGDAVWTEQDDVYSDAAPAWQSGAITDDQESWLQTIVTGPGTLTFDWKVSSESGYDFLYVMLDGVDEGSISGDFDWAEKSVTIPAGAHTVKWQYIKDSSVSEGLDTAWVDNIVFM